MIALLATQGERARAALDPAVVDYIDTGSGGELSRDEAEHAWSDVRLRPRVLCDVSSVDTRIELFGTHLAAPILVGPTATHQLVHPDGECATARGVRAAGSLLVVSTRASRAIEQIAAEVPQRWWFQVYLTRERRVIEGAVRAAVTAGAGALVLTGDTPVVGRKPRAGRPHALDSAAAQVNLGRYLPSGADPLVALEADPAATQLDIGWLAELSGLPVLVKGVLRGDDARRCVDAGAAGLIVSNHGGRQLDRAVSTRHALPEIVDAVAGDVPVLVDGGVRSGLDILTALALGARAVLLGRPVLWALAAAGADGVSAALTALQDDFAHCLALAGTARCADVDRSMLA